MTDRVEHAGVSRRLLLGGGAALAGVGLAGAGGHAAEADSSAPGGASRRSVRRAVSFLQQVLDAYRSSGPRFAQSYFDGSGLTDLAFAYDNALATIALLAGGDVTRARAIGDAYLSAQANDRELTDGRLRQTYHADGFTDADGKIVTSGIGLDFTAVGDMAWSGIALAHLARRTKDTRYREGAERIAAWIHTQRSDSGLGGYEFGTTPGLKGFKSTEHNIDVYAFFRMVATLTGDRVWRDRADHAWALVRRVWNSADGYFWTGSNDGSTINKQADQRPLDAQTWAWLAARERRYAGALDWAATNLATTDTPQRTNSELTGNYAVTGVAFGSGSVAADTTKPIDPYHGNPDSGAVWFEGTSQLALALSDRRSRGDRAAADRLLAQVEGSQDRLGADQTFGRKPVSGGIVAATSPLQTGYGFGYYPHLHVGATAWYVFAGTGTNPYRL